MKLRLFAWHKEGGFMLGVGKIDFEHKTFRPYHCTLDMLFSEVDFMLFNSSCKKVNEKHGKKIDFV